MRGILAACLTLANVVQSDDLCNLRTPLEKLDGLQCYGLDADAAAADEAECRTHCCTEVGCEAWQFHERYGCFRGVPTVCSREASSFAFGSHGERLRDSRGAKKTSMQAIGPNGVDLVWVGREASYSTFAAIEPYADGPEVIKTMGANGETFVFRRYGPNHLDILVSCWSQDRLPPKCCSDSTATCWGQGSREFNDRCCKQGVEYHSPNSTLAFTLYDVFIRMNPYLTDEMRLAYDAAIPKIEVDEAAFEATRLRWRIGTGDDLGSLCPSMAACTKDGCDVLDGSHVLWELVHMLVQKGVLLSRTFVNIGAGTCKHPDPMNQLVRSEEGRGFLGLAVDANAEDLKKCSNAMAAENIHATVLPLQMAVNTPTVAAKLRPHLLELFRKQGISDRGHVPLPLDLLAIDIDSDDCVVAEELLQLVQPKVLMLEIAFHIPPPFKFSLQHHSRYSKEWLEKYQVDQFNPVSTCSLSYAVSRLHTYGYQLFRLTYLDAVFVHSSIAEIVAQHYAVTLPQDEFLCYRRSRLWMQMDIGQVREWFFSPHPSLALGHIWGNISNVNEQLGRPQTPFSLYY